MRSAHSQRLCSRWSRHSTLRHFFPKFFPNFFPKFWSDGQKSWSNDQVKAVTVLKKTLLHGFDIKNLGIRFNHLNTYLLPMPLFLILYIHNSIAMFPKKPYTLAGFKPGSSCSSGGFDVPCAMPPGQIRFNPCKQRPCHFTTPSLQL
jgi:hypothetical protein